VVRKPKGAREAGADRPKRSSERPVEGRGEVEAAVWIDVVRVDELDQTQGRQLAQLLQVRCSKDWMMTGASLSFHPAAARMATRRFSIGSPMDL